MSLRLQAWDPIKLIKKEIAWIMSGFDGAEKNLLTEIEKTTIMTPMTWEENKL